MDGRSYLAAVRDLLASPSELERRVAAGPLYCAALNEARDALERWGFVAPAGDVYQFVHARFDLPLSRELFQIADALDRVQKYRALADDSRSPASDFADDSKVIRLLGLVEFVIDLLDQFEARPSAGRRLSPTSGRNSPDRLG
jgi:hypothetical protein